MTQPPDPTPTTDPTSAATKLMASLLEAQANLLTRLTTPGTRELPTFVATGLAAQYAGAAAYLLNQLTAPLGTNVDAIAAGLSEMLDLGEPLAEWCGEQHDAYGIDMDAIMRRLLKADRG